VCTVRECLCVETREKIGLDGKWCWRERRGKERLEGEGRKESNVDEEWKEKKRGERAKRTVSWF